MMPVITIWLSVVLTIGREVMAPWEYIEARVLAPKRGLAKRSLVRWSAVEFRGAKRCLDAFVRAHAIMFDVDDGTTLDMLRRAFGDLYAIVHSTFSSTPESPCWRVIVPLDWPASSVEEHDRAWRWLAARLERVGGSPHYGARDAAHAWAVPAIPPSGHYVVEIFRGSFALLREALDAIPPPEPLPVIERQIGDDYDRRLERASKYLAQMDPAIQGSNGSSATIRAAVALVRGFSLNLDDALRLLITEYNPRCAPPWSEWELQHKVRQAHQRGRMAFGALASVPRDGRAA